MEANDELYEPGICRECGKRLPQDKSLESFAARILHFCLNCYRQRFPERDKTNLPSARRRTSSGKWVDLRPLMSWGRENPEVWVSDVKEAANSRELLKEEKDE